MIGDRTQPFALMSPHHHGLALAARQIHHYGRAREWSDDHCAHQL